MLAFSLLLMKGDLAINWEFLQLIKNNGSCSVAVFYSYFIQNHILGNNSQIWAHPYLGDG